MMHAFGTALLFNSTMGSKLLPIMFVYSDRVNWETLVTVAMNMKTQDGETVIYSLISWPSRNPGGVFVSMLLLVEHRLQKSICRPVHVA